MTEAQAEKAANVLMGIAAAAAAYYILKSPPLRRSVWQLAKTAVASTGPAWLLMEARRGWEESRAAAIDQPRGI